MSIVLARGVEPLTPWMFGMLTIRCFGQYDQGLKDYEKPILKYLKD